MNTGRAIPWSRKDTSTRIFWNFRCHIWIVEIYAKQLTNHLENRLLFSVIPSSVCAGHAPLPTRNKTPQLGEGGQVSWKRIGVFLCPDVWRSRYRNHDCHSLRVPAAHQTWHSEGWVASGSSEGCGAYRVWRFSDSLRTVEEGPPQGGWLVRRPKSWWEFSSRVGRGVLGRGSSRDGHES